MVTLTELEAIRRHLTFIAEDPDLTLTPESRYELAQARRKVRDAITQIQDEDRRLTRVVDWRDPRMTDPERVR